MTPQEEIAAVNARKQAEEAAHVQDSAAAAARVSGVGSEKQQEFVHQLLGGLYSQTVRAQDAKDVPFAAGMHYLLTNLPAPKDGQQVSKLIDALKSGTPQAIARNYLIPVMGDADARQFIAGMQAASDRAKSFADYRNAGKFDNITQRAAYVSPVAHMRAVLAAMNAEGGA